MMNLALPIAIKAKSLSSLGLVFAKLFNFAKTHRPVMNDTEVPKAVNSSANAVGGAGRLSDQFAESIQQANAFFKELANRLQGLAKEDLAAAAKRLANSEVEAFGKTELKLLELANENDKVALKTHELALKLETLPMDALIASGALFAANLAYVTTFTEHIVFRFNAATGTRPRYFARDEFVGGAVLKVNHATENAYSGFEGAMRKDVCAAGLSGALAELMSTFSSTSKIAFREEQAKQLSSYLDKINASAVNLNQPEVLFDVQEMIAELADSYAKSNHTPMEIAANISSHMAASVRLQQTLASLLAKSQQELEALSAWRVATRQSSVDAFASMPVNWLAVWLDATRPFDGVDTYVNPTPQTLLLCNASATDKIAAAKDMEIRQSTLAVDSVVASVAERFVDSINKAQEMLDELSEHQFAEFVGVMKRITSWQQRAAEIGKPSHYHRRLQQILLHAAATFATCDARDVEGCLATLSSHADDAKTLVNSEEEVTSSQILSRLPRMLHAPLYGATHANNELAVAEFQDRLLNHLRYEYDKFFDNTLDPYFERVAVNVDEIRSDFQAADPFAHKKSPPRIKFPFSDHKFLLSMVKLNDALTLFTFHTSNMVMFLRSLAYQLDVLVTDTLAYASLAQNASAWIALQNASGGALLQASLAATLTKQARRIGVTTNVCTELALWFKQNVYKKTSISWLVMEGGIIGHPLHGLRFLKDKAEKSIAAVKGTYEAVKRDVATEIAKLEEATSLIETTTRNVEHDS